MMLILNFITATYTLSILWLCLNVEIAHFTFACQVKFNFAQHKILSSEEIMHLESKHSTQYPRIITTSQNNDNYNKMELPILHGEGINNDYNAS